MAELKQCEFFLLRYVPDAVKDEFVNIGVVMLSGGRMGFADLRMTRDWSRVKCVDPGADIEMLEAMEADLRRQLENQGDREQLLKRLEDSFSNLVQLSGTKACLTESPQAEMETLAKMYLESSRRPQRARDAGARTRIATRMRDAFERVNVWPLMMKKLPVATYTHRGDPLKIDCGYRPNGVVRLFHALALQSEVDSAKVLAFSFPQIREGMHREMSVKAELTAIVDSADRSIEQIDFAVETLSRSAIQVATVADLDRIAERARVEMRV